jgi:LacI family transcriptional regulator
LNASAVVCDHAQGVKSATADLIRNKHTKIAFISGRKDVFISRNRIKGFEEAMGDARIKIDESLIRLGKFGEDYAYEQTKDLFSGKNPPTALISGGIGASTGALRALKELKLKPGKDIAFVALDEWPMFDVLTADLSSVYRDPEEMGRQSARLILDLIADKAPSQAVVPTTYRPRLSSQASTHA